MKIQNCNLCSMVCKIFHDIFVPVQCFDKLNYPITKRQYCSIRILKVIK